MKPLTFSGQRIPELRTRIESGQLTLHPTPTDLASLLRAVVRRMAAQVQQRGLHLTLEMAESPPLLSIDAPRIEQVLLNLLQNAVAFTPDEGAIAVSVAVEAQQVTVAVRDTGVGIAPEDLPHIFKRFYKADRARSGGGTGLGLAIARHLVERHGGRIWAMSQPGQGTQVAFTLPIP